MVGVPASVNFPLHHKVQKFSSGTGSPWWSRKGAVKRLWWWLLTYLLTWCRWQADVLDGRERAESEGRVLVDDGRGAADAGQRAATASDRTGRRLLQERPRVLVRQQAERRRVGQLRRIRPRRRRQIRSVTAVLRGF